MESGSLEMEVHCGEIQNKRKNKRRREEQKGEL